MALSELIRKFGNDFVGALEKNLPRGKDASGKLRKTIISGLTKEDQRVSYLHLMLSLDGLTLKRL